MNTDNKTLPPLPFHFTQLIDGTLVYTAEQVREAQRAALAAQQGAQVPQGADAESRAMFVARLENMQENGDHWLTVASVLALLNDCDYLASRSASPQAAIR